MMVKKRVDLKKRLDSLRDEPPAPVAVSLVLDASLIQQLKSLAAHQRLTLEMYIADVLRKHSLDVEE